MERVRYYLVEYSYINFTSTPVLLDPEKTAFYEANGWQTDPLYPGGPQMTIYH
jgi:hypothetical protein